VMEAQEGSPSRSRAFSIGYATRAAIRSCGAPDRSKRRPIAGYSVFNEQTGGFRLPRRSALGPGSDGRWR